MSAAATGANGSSGNDSVIHDIGYQRYTGARLGRGYAVRSLYTFTLRTAFGLGRGTKAKIFPWSVAGLGLLIAAVAVAVRAQTNEVAISYLRFPDAIVILVIIFLTVVAPELVSRDLRAGVLPLYFARPLRRSDYALVKYAALATAVWLVLAVPQLLMFLGGAFGSTTGMSGVWFEAGDFAQGLGYAAIDALLLSSIAILVAALTGRRAMAAGAVVAVLLVTWWVVGILSSIGGQTQQQLAGLVSPVTLPQGIRRWLFGNANLSIDIGSYGPLYGAVGLAFTLLCVLLLVSRYRRVSQ